MLAGRRGRFPDGGLPKPPLVDIGGRSHQHSVAAMVSGGLVRIRTWSVWASPAAARATWARRAVVISALVRARPRCRCTAAAFPQPLGVSQGVEQHQLPTAAMCHAAARTEPRSPVADHSTVPPKAALLPEVSDAAAVIGVTDG